MDNHFLKRLGGLTATLSPRTRAFRRASSLLTHEAIRRKKQQSLFAEDMAEHLKKERFEEFFRQRKLPGRSGHYSWWGNITKFLNQLENDAVHQ